MSFRYVFGEATTRQVRVEQADAIEIGDLVYLDVDSIRSVSTITGGVSTATMQALVHDNFAGVAIQRKAAGDDETDAFMIATTGVWSFLNNAAVALEMGEFIGAGNNGSNVPLNQSVQSAAGGLAQEAIGHCAQRIVGTATEVRISIVSTVYASGVQTVI